MENTIIKIASVDDNETNLLLIEYAEEIIEEELGQPVVIFSYPDGQAFLDELPDIYPDIVLLDIMMPKPDGYEVLEVLKSSEQFKRIPVIFVSARAMIEEVQKGLKLGADAYVTKPFEAVELARVIRRLVDKS
jgi:CheY-like chemotaxis protein